MVDVASHFLMKCLCRMDCSELLRGLDGHFLLKEKGKASLQVQQTSFFAAAFRKTLQRASRPLVYIEICKKIISSYQTCLEMLVVIVAVKKTGQE